MSTLERPNQNTILSVQYGLQHYFDDVYDDLATINREFGSFASYADIECNPSALSFAQLSYGTLEQTNEQLSPQHLNAFSLGHVAAQLCTRFDGEILLINRGDESSAPPQDFRTILDAYFDQSKAAYGISLAFLGHDTSVSQTKPTEIYMAGAAMLLADLSNLTLRELEREIEQF